MKCSKCGEECKDNQVFCLKCGSPLHVVPDFNLIEAELANNIGEVMDGDPDEIINKVNDSALNDIHGDTVEYGNISDDNEQADEDESEDKDENEVSEEELEYINRMREIKKQKEEKKKKKIIVISAISAAIVAIIIVAVLIKVFSGESKYEQYYDQAVEYYEDGEYDNAVDQLLFAINEASSDEENIEARELLYAVYSEMDDVSSETMIDLINELIELDPDEEKYQEWLSLYSDDLPSASVSSGSYDEYFSVELTADADEIYYTLDDSTPTTDSTLYSDAIEVDTEGTTVLKAIAVSNGTVSDVVEFTYEITLAEVDAPEITPDGGNYTSETDITVTAEDGCTIYYTYDGTEPDETSTEYTGAVEMLLGNNVFSAIAVSEDGVVSSVVSNVYNLSIDENYTYNEAESMLIEKLVDNGTLVDSTGDAGSGATMEFDYSETAIIDNGEYYVITAKYYDSDGNYSTSYTYGVGTVSGTVVELSSSGSGYSIESTL